MHTYEKIHAEGTPKLPPIDSVRFRSAEDVAELARIDHTIGWMTWPEVWHLDESGTFTCCYKASSLCTLQGWAEDPYPLLRSRQEGLIEGGCGSDWLIIDSRPVWRSDRPAPDMADEQAFAEVERVLADIGVRLVDAVVFDDACHWWSLREMTKGTTQW